MSEPNQPAGPSVEQETSHLNLQARLVELQKKNTLNELSLDETREAISIIRTLRRTNTGPAATKKRASAGAAKKAPIDLQSLLD